MTLYLGLDPGRSGGCILLNEKGEIIFDDIFDGLKTDQDLYQKVSMLGKKFKAIHIFKEEFASYGVDGRTSFVVGRMHAAIDLACSLNGIPKTDVKPSEWSKYISGLYPEFNDLKPKIRNTRIALKLFPKFSFAPGARKKEHLGLIDASLIAWYGLKNLVP